MSIELTGAIKHPERSCHYLVAYRLFSINFVPHILIDTTIIRDQPIIITPKILKEWELFIEKINVIPDYEIKIMSFSPFYDLTITL